MMVGGLSFGIGASVGALVGGLGALIGSSQLARTKVLGLPIGGRELKVGPISDANIPWVVLGRAVLHQRLVAERNHARREIMVIEASGVDIAAAQRRQIDRRLGRIRNHGGANREERDALVVLIERLLDSQICEESGEQGREER